MVIDSEMNYKESFEEKYFINVYNGCWEWIASLDGRGYGMFRTKRAHRVSWLLYKGFEPGELFVCHHCDNPKCVNPNHLFLGTRSDNMRDMVKKGRQPAGLIPRLLTIGRKFSLGNRPHNLRLQPDDVHFIRESNIPVKELAVKFSVTKQTIYKIKSRKRQWNVL